MFTPNLTYVRWRAGEPRRGKVLPAPAKDHPVHGAPCLMCEEPMTEEIQLIAIGLTDEEDAEQAKRGEWFAAGAAIVHHACAEKLSDTELDAFAASLVVKEDA